ncbi:hypothetical protein [Paraburkholderia fynbosensis]|uniref:hypothetical protein n=1 Tax=Paraburkholderia fynbosensis TaxID=1200993 RepID=UPI0015835A6A|nr:hypothetical protein [Paraburkholderia fynbosensis]
MVAYFKYPNVNELRYGNKHFRREEQKRRAFRQNIRYGLTLVCSQMETVAQNTLTAAHLDFYTRSIQYKRQQPGDPSGRGIFDSDNYIDYGSRMTL